MSNPSSSTGPLLAITLVTLLIVAFLAVRSFDREPSGQPAAPSPDGRFATLAESVAALEAENEFVACNSELQRMRAAQAYCTVQVAACVCKGDAVCLDAYFPPDKLSMDGGGYVTDPDLRRFYRYELDDSVAQLPEVGDLEIHLRPLSERLAACETSLKHYYLGTKRCKTFVRECTERPGDEG